MRAPIQGMLDMPLEETYVVGTGYGRQTLPFPKEAVRSEILCHGLGAHAMFPATRTVLDIGGQTVTSIITRDACRDLGLKVGETAAALIKATEVMIMRV